MKNTHGHFIACVFMQNIRLLGFIQFYSRVLLYYLNIKKFTQEVAGCALEWEHMFQNHIDLSAESIVPVRML